jgi:HD-GYP domain-containing protein (c-di-GMP phosphodiesterase class II)
MARVEDANQHLTELNSLYRSTVETLAMAIDAKDQITHGHIRRVQTYALGMAEALRLTDPTTLKALEAAAVLHDMGKVGVPEHILNKPGKLTEAEFEIMKKHVDLGLETLEQTPGISQTVLQVAGEHHERFEGTGYPKRLKGSDISLLGRMAAIVDVYDALTSNRVYHRGMEPPEALKKLFEWSSHHFDEELVQHFIQAIGIYPVGTLVRLESERLAVVIEQGEQGLLHPKVRVIFDIRRNARIGPLDLDLASNQAGEDAIAGNEEPGAWNLNPFDYLSLEI